jgi:serine/threonine protein kinase
MARAATAIDSLLSQPEESRTLGVFHLVHQLGKGGFAPVWLAREVYGETVLRAVAIKLFAPDDGDASASSGSGGSGSSSTAQQRERIIEEARALCQVEHPNVVRFYSIFHDPAQKLIGLVMEYVQGTPLDARLEELHASGKRFSIAETLDVGVAVASALVAVHQVGLIHRDIKPANVVETAGVYKLIDFGIAAADTPRSAGASGKKKAAQKRVLLDDLMIEVGTKASMISDTVTVGGATDVAFSLSGTFGYIDPHCVATLSAATPASDLYSLGATLFECVTGRVPAAIAARAEGASGLKGEVLDGRAAAPPLARVAPEVPPSFAKLVDALLDPSPAKRPKSAEAVAWELERIRREIGGRVRPLPPEDVGPFRGLGRFEEKDRDVHFGRAVEIAASLEMARARGLVALIGASGSGKSSLARAGVLPAITDGELGKWPKTWDAVVATPGADARASVAAALARFVDDAATKSPETVVTALAERVQSSGRGVCVLVDQLEELVTVSSPASRDWVVQLLAQLGAQPVPGVRCVVAARRDLLDPLLALGELGRVLTKGTLLVSPMSDATWGEVIDQALSAYGYTLEDAALRTELLGQLEGTVTAMPLVQFALTQLWERRDQAKKVIPRAALEAIGGIAGALEMHAEATLARHAQSDAGIVDVTRRVLLALTTAQGTRRMRTEDDLARQDTRARALLERLERSRLVVRESEGITLAHEALLTQWRRLRAWIEEAREERLLAEAIERDAAEWASARDAERLWKKRRLAAAEELAKKGHAEISETARAFVRAGRAAERRGWVALVVVVGCVFVALAAVATYAVGQAASARAAAASAENETKRAEAAQAVAEAARKKSDEDAKIAQNALKAQEAAQAALEEDQKKLEQLLAQVSKARSAKELAEAQAKVAAALKTPAPAPAPAPQPAPVVPQSGPTIVPTAPLKPASEVVGQPP